MWKGYEGTCAICGLELAVIPIRSLHDYLRYRKDASIFWKILFLCLWRPLVYLDTKLQLQQLPLYALMRLLS